MDYYRNFVDEEVICLYDKIYVIRKGRLLCYLIKCVKNNKVFLKNFIFCEFNYSYKIKRGDGSDYYKYCKEKQIYEGWFEWDNMCIKKGDIFFLKYKDIQIDGENWDEELEFFFGEKYYGFIVDIKK